MEGDARCEEIFAKLPFEEISFFKESDLLLRRGSRQPSLRLTEAR